jgi:hypothetical protein
MKYITAIFFLLTLFSTTLYARKPLDYRMSLKSKSVEYNMYTLNYDMCPSCKVENVEKDKKEVVVEQEPEVRQTIVRRWRWR